MQFVNAPESPLESLADLKGCTVDELLQMTRLDLRRVNPSSLPEEIGQLTRVRELFVSFSPPENKSHPQLPSSISLMTGLTKLVIEHAMLPEFPEVLLNCTQLCELSLTDCSLSAIPSGLSRLSVLEKLNLSHNLLRAIPSDIQYLEYIRELDFSYNQIAIQQNRLWAEYISRNVDDPYRMASVAMAVQSFTSNANFSFQNEKNPAVCASQPTANNLDISIPPEMCRLPLCSLSIVGNHDITPEIAARMNLLFMKESDIIVRSIKMFDMLSNVPKVVPIQRDAFEIYASNAISTTTRPNDLKKLDKIIKLTIQYNAFLILEVPIIREYIQNLWGNKANIKEYLQSSSKVTPRVTSPGSLIKWFWFWFSMYLKNIIPRFCGSVRGKYFLSLLFYVLYLVVLLMYVIDKNTSGGVSVYSASQVLKHRFDVSSLTDVGKIWPFIEDIFIENYAENMSDFESMLTPESKNVTHSFYRPLLGFRLRQLRVKEIECDIDNYRTGSAVHIGHLPRCSPSYGRHHRDTHPFGPGDRFKFRRICSEIHLPMVSPAGFLYECNGFIEFVKLANKTNMLNQVQDLKDNYWIDHLTRYIAIEYAVSFDNIKCLSVGVINIEILPTGLSNAWIGMQSIPKEWVSKATPKTTGYHLALLTWAVSFFFFQIQRLRLSLRNDNFDSWFFYDIALLIIFSMTAFVEFEIDYLVNKQSVEQVYILIKAQRYTDLAYLWSVDKVLIGWIVLMSFIRVLFYTNVDPNLGPMQSIVRSMIQDIIRFFVFLLAFMIAFCTYFYTIYGQRLSDYSLYSKSFYVTMSSIFGGFDPDSLAEVQLILGRVDSYVFSMITSIILLNFLIAVLSGTYNDVQSESLRQYKMLFCETVFFLKNISLPPPLNVFSPIFWAMNTIWKSRLEFWGKFIPYHNYQKNIQLLFPFPRVTSVWSSSLKTWCGFTYVGIDAASIIIHWLILILLLILISPFIFLLKKVSEKLWKTCEKAIFYFFYIVFLSIWCMTLPAWGVLFAIFRPIELLYLKFIHKQEKEKDYGDGDVCLLVEKSTPQNDTSQYNSDGVNLSAKHEVAYVDILCGSTRLPKSTIVSDVPWTGFSGQESMYFNVSSGSGIVGFVPHKSLPNVLPGVGRNSFGFNTKTGEVYFESKLIGVMSKYMNKSQSLITFSVDYVNSTLTVSCPEQVYVAAINLVTCLQISPAVRITSPNTTMLLRIFKSLQDERGRRLHPRNIESLASGHPKVIITSFPPTLCSLVESPEFFTWQSPDPVYRRDGNQYSFFEFEAIHPGKDGILVLGFSVNDLVKGKILGDTAGSIRVAIDVSRRKATFVDNNQENGMKTTDANLARLFEVFPCSFGFIIDYSKLRYWMCVNKRVIPLIHGRIRSETTQIYPGITFITPHQYVRYHIGYPPPYLVDQLALLNRPMSSSNGVVSFTEINQIANEGEMRRSAQMDDFSLNASGLLGHIFQAIILNH